MLIKKYSYSYKIILDQIITGLSNKSIQIFDTNVEKVGMTILQAHNKPVSCIRINEAPKGGRATDLCDFFLTSSYSNLDPIKLWDLRSAKWNKIRLKFYISLYN